MASSTNINNDTLVELEKVRYLSKENFISENARTNLKIGDILLTTVGTLGRSCVYDNDLKLCFQRSVTVITTLLFNHYLKNFFDSNFFQEIMIKEGTGTAQKGFYLNQLSNVLIPVPPIDEQKRISEYISQLSALIKNVDNNKIILYNLIKKTKAKVLDLAIRGKLVPQDPNDEPADKLLEKIREEKEKLIKESKLKRDKNETYIFKNSDDNSYYEQIDGETVCIDDDLPFEIPNSWRWCSLGNIGDWGAGSTPNRNKFEYYNNGTIPWLKTGDLNDSFIENIPEHITEQALKETSVSIKPKGSILIAMYGATIGKLGILNIDSTTNQACCACQCIYINNLYLFYYLMSQRNNFKKMGLGGAQPNISRELLVNYYFALPPINEQLKIVSKIKDIFAQLDTIQEIFNK